MSPSERRDMIRKKSTKLSLELWLNLGDARH